jgi:hypothetical protein
MGIVVHGAPIGGDNIAVEGHVPNDADDKIAIGPAEPAGYDPIVAPADADDPIASDDDVSDSGSDDDYDGDNEGADVHVEHDDPPPAVVDHRSDDEDHRSDDEESGTDTGDESTGVRDDGSTGVSTIHLTRAPSTTARTRDSYQAMIPTPSLQRHPGALHASADSQNVCATQRLGRATFLYMWHE